MTISLDRGIDFETAGSEGQFLKLTAVGLERMWLAHYEGHEVVAEVGGFVVLRLPAPTDT